MTGLLDAPPAGEDQGMRRFVQRIADLETTVQQVQAASAGNAALLAFLADQDVTAEAAPGAMTQITTNPATSTVPRTWVAYNAAADATRTITTSSTGRISFRAGGYLWMAASFFASQWAFIGVEILAADGVTQVRAPQDGDGNLSMVRGQDAQATNTATGQDHEWTLAPNTTYVMRCRRGYRIDPGSTGAIASVGFVGTSLNVQKIGM